MMLLVFSGATTFSQQTSPPMNMDGSQKPATLVSGMGSVRHAVSTTSPEAQKFFDQGLAYIYAFNHQEAVRSFKRAAELDPQLAMAYWGIALALGPNINLDVDPEREKAAFDATQKALKLAAKAPENERAYIAALSKRYSDDPKADLKKLAIDYKNAMGELVRNYPDDLDAATLYAESAMDLRPWQLWTADGKPAEGTEEIVATLESVLKRNPNHFGAIHYYIHAVEASPNPDRALAYAPKLPELVPAAGHLVHMPAHIYQRTGDYNAAAESNKVAALTDESYIKATGAQGMYPLMYYTHNLHFLAVASSMAGNYAESIEAANRLESYFAPFVKQMPMLGGFMTTSNLMLVRFRKWDDILKVPQPAPEMTAPVAVWHFARGMAYVAKGDVPQAKAEHEAFLSSSKRVPADFMFNLNSASSILEIADDVLAARIAEAGGDKKAAVEILRKAVTLEDALAYDEPPAWFLPVRESLGGVLLRAGDYAAAEQVFRADLERNRRNGRSLFGLMESLKGQKKDYAAASVQEAFDSAWKGADTKLTVADL
jgi:tetratricopeptide (TPR) repeat protein